MFHCDSVSIHVCTELSDKLMTLKQSTTLNRLNQNADAALL